MRILLVVKSKKMECLGPMYISSVVKKSGHECRIIDMQNAKSDVMMWKPHMIGYSVLTGDQKQFIKLNQELRKVHKFGAIFGGPHATFFSDDFADEATAMGESEQDIADLFNYEVNYKNIDDIPWPDRTSFPNMKIRDFLTTRGCPWGKCSYCYNSQWNKINPGIQKLRIRSAKDVVNEISHVEPRFVYFQDSSFGSSMKWLRTFRDEYQKVYLPYHAHLEPNQVKEERIILMRDSGCYSVRIALESASTKIRKLLSRPPMKNDDISKSVQLLKKWHIKVMLQSMIGIPTGSIEDDLETLNFNIRCQPDYAWVSIFTPYPGTELGNFCKKEGWYTGDYSDIGDNFFDRSVLNFSDEYKEQLECLQKIFALCVETKYLPMPDELTYSNLPTLVHKIMRRVGDKRLYGGAI